MLFFWLKEALRIFERAKSSSILSLISLTVSVLLISLSIYISYLSNNIETKIKQQYIINIFLNDTVTNQGINQLYNTLQEKAFIFNIEYIDKETAAENFIKDTGEDFRDILDYNPIPASFAITLKSEFVNKDSLRFIKEDLLSLQGVDEIAMEQELLDRIIKILISIKKYIFILTGILVLVSIYISYSTIKLVIALKHDELETMKLVGAKISTIKMPIILNELITGFAAGILAAGFIKAISLTIVNYNVGIDEYFPPNNFLLIPLCAGSFISLFVSLFVLRRITLKV